MNDDVYLEVITRSDPGEIQKLCSSNKHYNTLCKHYREYISKAQLKRYQVDYKDPGNFIYKMNGVEFDPKRSYYDIFKLFLGWFYEKEVYCGSKEITSIPNYIFITWLDCNNNLLTSLPQFPNLEYLDCSENQLTSLPDLPKVETLDCSENQLTFLPELPNVVDLVCFSNNLSSLPDLPNISILICFDNQLFCQRMIHIL